MKKETQNFYQDLLNTITHHSDFSISSVTIFNTIDNLRIFQSKIEKSINPNLTEEKQLELKKYVVTLASSIKYITEMHEKLLHSEKQLTDQKIINLNLLISNKEKEEKIKQLIDGL